MAVTILDCYTDEPAGLGVPPYLGTYPRYIAGSLEETPYYITIDDLRNYYKPKKSMQKTNIKTYNLTKNKNIKEIIQKTSELIIIAGVHTPGKYLSAVPGTLREIINLIKEFNCSKILAGPAVFGTSTKGGGFFERTDLKQFDEIKDFNFSYDEINPVKGSEIIKQIPDLRIIEIESSKGCSRAKGCSFCTEPIKGKLTFRDNNDIIKEIKAFYDKGVYYFRLGKQSCFYSLPEPVELLKTIRKQFPKIKVLHIDNVNPANTLSKRGIEITKSVVRYCTEGNIASFGVESFDKEVYSANNLNCSPDDAVKAVKSINKYGAEKGDNGMPKYLPGINLLFGLINESKQTHEANMEYLTKILDNYLVRRINIRQVNIFEGTHLFNTAGNKFIKKNKKYYWKWRNEIRQKIDYPMLKKLVPEGTVLKNIRTEVHDGKTTFGRQIGTYPLIVGIKQRLELNKFYDVKVRGHMLRSIVCTIL